MVAGDPCSICRCTHRHTRREHLFDWRTGHCRVAAKAANEILPLIGHAMLDGDPAAESTGAVNVAIRDRFRMIEEPAQAVERDVPIDPLEHPKETLNRLVVGRMDAEGPAGGNQSANDRFKFGFHDRAEVGARLEEVLKVGGAPDQILARTGNTKHVITFARLGHADPSDVIGQFASTLLREKAIGDPQGELIVLRQAPDDTVVLWKVLPAAPGIVNTCNAEAVHLPKEVARGIEVEARPNDMGMGIVQAGDDTPSAQVDDLCLRASRIRLGVVNADNSAFLRDRAAS